MIFKSIISGASAILFFRIAGAISALFITLLISNYYEVKILGIYSVMVSIFLIYTLLSRFGFDIYTVKKVSVIKNDGNAVNSYFKLIGFSGLITSLITIMIFFLTKNVVSVSLFDDIEFDKYVLLFSLTIVFFTLYSIFLEVFLGYNYLMLYSAFRNFLINFVVLLLLTSNIFFALNIDPIKIYFYSIYICFFVLVIFFALRIPISYAIVSKQDALISIKKIFSESYHIFYSNGLIFVMASLDLIMIGLLLSDVKAGIYSVCMRIGMLVLFVVKSINSFVAPHVALAHYNHQHNKIKEIYYNSLKVGVFFSLIFVVGISLFSEEILGLFGDEYMGATSTLILVGVFYLMDASFGPIEQIFNMTGRQKVLVYIMLCGFIINIILNLVLIKGIGINGAAIGGLISVAAWRFASYKYLKLNNVL